MKVTARAGRDELRQTDGGEIAVRVAAPPADGQANKAVCQLVAKAVGVPKSTVEVASGATARNKSLLIRGVDEKVVAQRLTSYFAER